jgi:small subunit ribosomal protein S4
MKKSHKKYSKPKKPFDKTRIEEEAKIKGKFGLKNKKEIWKAEEKIKEIREKAKKLVSGSKKEKEILFNKLKKVGINANSIGDVLSLEKEDYLKRRLQTVLVEKKFATTQKQARQLITHKKVLLNKKGISSPSHIVSLEDENKIFIKNKNGK